MLSFMYLQIQEVQETPEPRHSVASDVMFSSVLQSYPFTHKQQAYGLPNHILVNIQNEDANYLDVQQWRQRGDV